MLLSKPNSKARFATTRESKKHMDRLSRDACAATAAGMSYGQYKALHPHTPDEPDEVTALPKLDNGVVEKVCVWCGKKYLTKKKQQKYCTEKCYKAANRQMKRDRAKEREKQEENNNGQE